MHKSKMLAILRMPPEFWRNDEQSVASRYKCYQRAASIIMKVADLEKKIDTLYDTIEDIQHCDCPICKRVKGIGMSECDHCGWNVMR